MSRSLLAIVSLLLVSAASADVTVRRVAAEPGEPSPAARTCDLRFRAHTPVFSTCAQPCYVESWDGPVLLAANTCSDTILASYVYAADDGRTWRTPCYELAPGADAVAIPEATLEPWAERRVVIVMEPGTLGYEHVAPGASCPPSREVQPSTAGQ